MAKRKKMGKTRHHRRRRVGAMKHSPGIIETTLGVVAGAVVGDVIANAITAPAYVLGVAEVIVGGGMAYFAGGTPLIAGLGMGVAAAGMVSALQDAGAIQGIAGMIPGSSAATMIPRRVAGFRDVPAIGNFPKPAMVGRTDAMLKRAYKGVY